MQSVEVALSPALPPRRSSNDFFDGADVSPDGVALGGPLSDDDSAQSPPEPPPRSTGEAPAPERERTVKFLHICEGSFSA